MGTFPCRAASPGPALGLALCLLASSLPAATFEWMPGSGVTTTPESLQSTVGGVTATARGYTVEYAGSASTVFGPYPTNTGLGGHSIFGIDVRHLGVEGLGLVSQPLPGIGVAGADCCNPVRPGIDSAPYVSGNRAVKKLEMVVFEFSSPVRIVKVSVDDVSNSDRDFWVAGCASAPSFGAGLRQAVAGCIVKNKNDDISDGSKTQNVGIDGVRYLLMGARPLNDIGKIAVGVGGIPYRGGAFNIVSIETSGGGGGEPGPGSASIGDLVWEDRDGDGIQDRTETGVPGVSIALRACNGESDLATTTTDGNGNYSFTDLAEGRYELWVDKPAGYDFSPTQRGTSRAKDSDALASGKIGCVKLVDGKFKRGFDAGLVPR